MSSQISSRRWPMITSLLVSFAVFSVLVSLREHPAKEQVLVVVLWISIILAIAAALFFAICQFIQRLRQSVWVSTIPSALIVYFGVLIISLSYYKDLLIEMKWDPSMIGLGIAVVAFGWGLFTQRQ